MKLLANVHFINDCYYITTKDWAYSESDIILGKCNNIDSLDYEILTVTQIMPHSKSICCTGIWTEGSEEKIIFTNDEVLINKGISKIDDDLFQMINVITPNALPETKLEIFYDFCENRKYLHYDYFVYVDGIELIEARVLSKNYIFTEKEIDNFAHDIMILGMELRQNQLSGFDQRSGNDVLKEYLNKELIKFNK